MMRISLVLCALSLVATSFATQVWQLILFQGVLYGIAGGLAYAPVMVWLSEWFVERRGLAGACIFGGSGFGGSIVPIIQVALLQGFGFRWTLRIWSVVLLVFGGLVVWFSKPRLPVAPASLSGRRRRDAAPITLKFLREPLFLTIAATIFLQSSAYFSVSLYIPSYSTALGYSTFQGTIALSVFNLANSGGGFSAIQPPASATVASAQSALVIFCFFVVKGAAVIIGPLIAAALHPKKVGSSALRAGKGGWGGYGFTGITIFVGTAMAATAVMGVVSAIIGGILICTGVEHST
ncbi:MFS general substrate transporter [Clavulina sp. PMI_390]|nr:MFS general substrate transporter [Clavulina sp. PMI_390]